jgi:hypothetical protein
MDFLLRFSTATDALLDEAVHLIQDLLTMHQNALHAANTALRESSRNAKVSVVSLDNLRVNLER